MMKFLLIVAAAVAVSQANLLAEEWTAFKATHQKTYESHEHELLRQKIYLDNKQMVEEHNARYEKGLATYKMALNQFADMLPHEFTSAMNGYNNTLRRSRGAAFVPPQNFKAPSSIDWRQYGAVTPVKNQGQCGSCWSFSATGALEGQTFRKSGQLVSLSEQNLMDCSSNYGNAGCNGGLMDAAFEYIRDNQGVDTESYYPYEMQQGYCRYNAQYRGASDTGYVDVQQGSENALQQAVGAVGPVAIAIDASQQSFQFYSSGVYYEPRCSSSQLDHGVLAVGYGTEGGYDYWLVKNSWGPTWGEAGYVKMVRNYNNHCGVATQASYPLV